MKLDAMSFGIKRSAKLEYIKCEAKAKWRRTEQIIYCFIRSSDRIYIIYPQKLNIETFMKEGSIADLLY